MPRLLHVLADTLVTLLGFALLAFSVWRIQVDASALGPMLVAFSVLAINLLAALLVKTRLRREPGLLLLHVGLLALVFLAGAGRLGRYEATVEIVDGQRYSDALPIALTHGPWYRPERHRLEFIQGGYRVDYAPGLRRGDTRSQVQVADASYIVGDEEPLVIDGHRFYTTHNKGFAVVLVWTGDRGEMQSGAVHMPGYPLYGGSQENRFPIAGGPTLDLNLHLETPLDGERAWRLDSRKVAGRLTVSLAGKGYKLAPGESLALPGGRLHFESLRGWMGYRVFYDPMLAWLFLAAALSLVGLAWHLLAARWPGRWPGLAREAIRVA